jgi:hypothetical protein
VPNATSALLRGRLAAESLMQDACTIRRKTGGTTDPETGSITPVWTVIYTGKCKIQQVARLARPNDVGEAYKVLDLIEVHVPVAATGFVPDDVATVDASALDPDLAGRQLIVRGLIHKTFLTARRLLCQEVTS